MGAAYRVAGCWFHWCVIGGLLELRWKLTFLNPVLLYGTFTFNGIIAPPAFLRPRLEEDGGFLQ